MISLQSLHSKTIHSFKIVCCFGKQIESLQKLWNSFHWVINANVAILYSLWNSPPTNVDFEHGPYNKDHKPWKKSRKQPFFKVMVCGFLFALRTLKHILTIGLSHLIINCESWIFFFMCPNQNSKHKSSKSSQSDQSLSLNNHILFSQLCQKNCV